MDITSLTRRQSRHALSAPNAVYYLWRFGANGLRTGRALTASRRFADARTIAARLTKDGIAVGPSDGFLSADGQAACAAAAAGLLETGRSADVQRLVTSGDADERRKKYLIHLASYGKGIPPDDPLLKVGLDTKLLEIVASYLGFWPCLYSLGAWLNFPTDTAAELSQIWHRDPEDLRLVKAFIYLTDVGEENGPFTYVPKTHPFGSRTVKARRLEKNTRVPDERMNGTFPPEAWRVCTGPAGTMILADTVGYHRGGKPTAGQRMLMTFTYTSGTPIDDSGMWLQRRPEWIAPGIQASAVSWLLSTNRRKGRPSRD